MEKGPNYSDVELLQKLQAGSDLDNVIRHLYRSHYRMVNYYIIQNNGSDADAQDIFQEVVINFVKTVQAGLFRAEARISTYMHTLARNAWINEVKKRDRIKRRDEKFHNEKQAIETDVGGQLINREITTQIDNLLQALGENCKKILLAFYFDNLPMKEILKIMHFENEQVLRNKKYKCMKQLEQIITANPAIRETLQSFLTHER